MDYSIFDVLLDSVFILGEERQVIYCNEVAATLCDSSVKRLTRGKPIFEFIKFSDEKLFSMPNGQAGLKEAFPLEELDFELVGSQKVGKVQVAAQPFKADGKSMCVLLVRDVTIEEVLHNKHKAQLEQLENYSKNLEKMVEERTAELNSANQMLSAIMNSLGQGFLVFDQQGHCLDIYTKACENILEKVPAGKNILRVLNLTGANEEQFKLWMQAVFSNSLPFDSLKELAPKYYEHTKGSHITLDYFPIQETEDQVKNIVLVATDRSVEFEAQNALEREKHYAQMIVKLVSNRKQFSSFLSGIKNHLGEIYLEIEKSEPDIDFIFRNLHTLEGEAATFSVVSLQTTAKLAQDVISPIREDKSLSLFNHKSIFKEKLRDIEGAHDLFLTSNNELLKLVNLDKDDVIEVNLDSIKYFVSLFKQKGLPNELCDGFLLEIAKRPIKEGVFHFASLVNQIAEKQGKRVNSIEFVGLDTRLDFEKYGNLLGSLVHVFRNIVDHGLEIPSERIEAGKPEFGNIRFESKIESSNEGTQLKIDIYDDGRGIDPKVIQAKYPQKDSAESDHLIIQHIFDPGLSSREETGEYSGRGVGMDAVKTEVIRLDGKVEVFSQVGKGTHLSICVPMENIDLELKLGA